MARASQSPVSVRALAWGLIALTAPGCSTFQATPLASLTPPAAGDTLRAEGPEPHAAQPAPGPPDRVRVRLLDGSEFTLEHPRVDGDSLRGINVPENSHERPSIGSGKYEPILGRVPRAVALHDIARIETRKFSGVNSLLALIGFGALVYLAALLAYGLSSNGVSD